MSGLGGGGLKTGGGGGSGGGTVTSVTAADTTIIIGGTSAAPTVARAAISGDVAVAGGSDAATVQAIQGFPVSSAAPSTNYVLLWNGSEWVPTATATVVIRVGNSYSVSGLLAVASGATNYLPPFFAPVPAGQTVKFAGIYAVVRSATSVTVSINQNGSGVTGVTAVVVTTTAGFTAATTPPTVSNGDEFVPVISSVSGTPDGLSITFFFDVTVV
jgi:hypothetical protein